MMGSIMLAFVAGLSATPAFAPGVFDTLDRAMKMRAGFRMHRQNIRARVLEIFDKGIHRRNHQMHVEWQG